MMSCIRTVNKCEIKAKDIEEIWMKWLKSKIHKFECIDKFSCETMRSTGSLLLRVNVCLIFAINVLVM